MNNITTGKLRKRYILPDIQASILRIDVLIYCCYCLQQKQNKLKIHDIWSSLKYYDYHYSKKHQSIKKEIKSLFPLYHNGHKRNKIFKINKKLVAYWGQKFGLDYQQHRELFEVFKAYENKK